MHQPLRNSLLLPCCLFRHLLPFPFFFLSYSWQRTVPLPGHHPKRGLEQAPGERPGDTKAAERVCLFRLQGVEQRKGFSSRRAPLRMAPTFHALACSPCSQPRQVPGKYMSRSLVRDTSWLNQNCFPKAGSKKHEKAFLNSVRFTNTDS